jgi:hypothetical protein
MQRGNCAGAMQYVPELTWILFLRILDEKEHREQQEAEAKVRELTRESRDLAAKAKEIEDAVYDLKAVNPNKKPNVDTRTLEELIDIIEAKGREVAEALAKLRSLG